MAIVEDVADEEELVKPPTPPVDTADLKTKLFAELACLGLPTKLLRVDKELPHPSQKLDQFKYTCLTAVQHIRSLLESQRESAIELKDEDIREVVFGLTKLIGKDDWCSPSVIQVIRECLSLLPASSSMPHQLLLNKIKPIFSTHLHPDINPETGRKLLRPAGGEAARQDMFEGQRWKEYEGWGAWCVLSWCVEAMSKEDLTENVGLVLPPLLILLDDYEPIYRLRGMETLEIIMDRLSPVTMKRMGIDKLFLKSIQNSIALHPSFPQPIILPRSFSLLIRLLHIITPPNSIERATEIAEAVEKGIINGWQYAPSGFEGVATFVGVAECVERLCDEVGVEVIRWLKSFIPSLLSPLFLPPTPFSIPLQQCNLSALLAILRASKQTGRAARWRGQILDALGRTWAGCVERLEFGVEQEDDVRTDDLKSIQELCIKIGSELAKVAPSMKQEELPSMTKLSKRTFGPFAQAVSAG